MSTRTVAGVSFRPQISAHTGTNTSISTTAATRAGTAIDLTCPCSRRTAPPSGESRRSMRDESDTRRARHQSRCARLLAVLPLATRDGSQGTPPPPPERKERFAVGAVRRLRRQSGFGVTAGGADEILSERIADQYRRARTGLLRAGSHSLASSSKRSMGGCPWTRVPRCREPLGGGQSVGEVVTGWVGESATVHHSPYTCSRIAGTHSVRTRQTSPSIALRDVANPATLRVRCGSSSPLLRSRPSDRSSVYGGTGAR